MKRYRVTWTVEVDAMTPRGAADIAWWDMISQMETFKTGGGRGSDCPSLTVTGLADNHTTMFDPQATDALR